MSVLFFFFLLLLFLLIILFFLCHSNNKKKSLKLKSDAAQHQHSNFGNLLLGCPSQEQSGTGHQDRSPGQVTMRTPGQDTHHSLAPRGQYRVSDQFNLHVSTFKPKLLTAVGSRRSRRSGIRSPRRQLRCGRRWLLGYGEIPTLIRLWCVYVLGKIKGQMWASRKVKYHKI